MGPQMSQLSMMVGRRDGSAPYTWHSNQHNHPWHRHGRGSEQHQLPGSLAAPLCHWNQVGYQPKAKRLFSWQALRHQPITLVQNLC